MTENIFRHCATPAEGVAGLQSGAHLSQEEVAVVVGQVAQRHVSIQEFECFLFLRGQFLLENVKQGFAAPLCQFLSLQEILVHLLPIVPVADKMLAARR